MQETIEQITADKLDAILTENKFKIIDVRNPKGITKQGSIPSAVNIPFDSVERAVDIRHEEYNAIFNNDGPFLFCCTGGVMSYMAALKAQEKGIQRVCNLEGGHAAWLKLRLPNSLI